MLIQPFPLFASNMNRQPGRTGAEPFRLPGQGVPNRSGAVSTATLASLPTLLAIQEIPVDAIEPRRRAVRRGEQLLDGLDRLHRAMLAGEDGATCLAQLRALMGEHVEQAGDVDLAGVLAEIDVRVAVEIAKREAPD